MSYPGISSERNLSVNITTLSNERTIEILRRNDLFLSYLNKSEAALLGDKVQFVDSKSDIDFNDFYTLEKLKDLMTDNLSRTEVIICGKIKIGDKEQNREYEVDVCRRVPKYSDKVVHVARFAAFHEQARILTISLSDLDPRLLRELQGLDRKGRQEVITDAGKRLFKIYFPHYFNHKGDLIRVRAEP